VVSANPFDRPSWASGLIRSSCGSCLPRFDVDSRLARGDGITLVSSGPSSAAAETMCAPVFARLLVDSPIPPTGPCTVQLCDGVAVDLE